MTKITVDKDLIEQALDTIGYYASVCGEDEQETPAKRTQKALRAALAKPVVETDDPLHCDLCGDATDDPWHFSTSQDRHKHACDKCWESLKESDTICKPPAEPAVEQCGYDETTGNCTKNPCCYTSPPPPAEVPLLSDDEIGALVRVASKGGTLNRDGSTSQRIARAIEQAVRQKAGLK